MRLLLLLILAGVGAFMTVPPRAAHEEAARAFMQQEAQQQAAAVEQNTGISLESVVDFVTGVATGQGRYETYYVASKFTVDMPGAAYLECWGAFTLVQCRKVDRGAEQG